MIKTIVIDGVKMTAIVLGRADANDPEDYRESLLDVLDAAMQNTEAIEAGYPNGSQFSDCMRLARAMEPEVTAPIRYEDF